MRFGTMLSQKNVWITVVILLLIGCTSGKNPVMPTSGLTDNPDKTAVEESTGRYLWGEYIITMKDIEDSSGNVTGVDLHIYPRRSSHAHFDVTSFVKPPMCSDCVTIQPVEYIPGNPYSWITATVFLTNPTNIQGYDVRGIIYPTGDNTVSLENKDGYSMHDGLTTLYPEVGVNPPFEYRAFNKQTKYRPFAGKAKHGASYIFKKLNSYKLYSMVYKIDASAPTNAKEPVDAYVYPFTKNDHVYPQGANAVLLVSITDWQDNVTSVSLNLSALGEPYTQQMTKISEDKTNHTSKWQYVITKGAGYPGNSLRTVRLTATSADETLQYMKDFEILVKYDTDPPSWKVPGQEGIYDHVSAPDVVWLFFHEAWDISVPIQYIFYGNDVSPAYAGSVLKVVLSTDYKGYTPFGGYPNQKRFYGLKLQDAQGWGSGETPEYSLTRYSVDPRWSFIKDQPPGSEGILGAPAIGDVNGDGKKDIVVGARNGKVYVYGGSGTGTQDTIIWQYTTGAAIEYCSPALVDLNNDKKLDVVIASDDCNVYALNGATGLPLWTYDAGNDFLMHSSPAIAQLNGTGAYDVVIGTGQGNLIALNGNNGAEIWKYETGSGIASTPAVVDVTGDGVADVCFGSYDTKIHMVNGATGKVIWTYYLGPGMYNIDCSPVMVDISGDGVPDCIFGGRHGNPPETGVLIALDGASKGPSANELWIQEMIYGNARRSVAPVKLNADNVWDFVVTSYQGEVYSIYAVNGLNGSFLYRRLGSGIKPDSPFNYSAPIVGDFTGDGHMNAIYGRQDGYCDLVNLDGFNLPGEFAGKILYKMMVTNSSNPEIYATPAVDDVDGDGELELIVCDMRGYTYVLDLHAPVPTDPAKRAWMQHQGNRWHTGTPGFIPPDE